MNWKVFSLDCFPKLADRTNVVFRVHWLLEDGDKSIKGMIGVPSPSDEFTDFNLLTEDQVLGWIWANGVNKESTEAALQSPAPSAIRPALPWA